VAGFGLPFFSSFVNVYTKVAQSVIRLVAFVLVVMSFFLYAADLYLFLSHRPVPGPGWMVLKGVPFLIGLLLFWKSRALAERLTKDLD
jgi:hypothetical protein